MEKREKYYLAFVEYVEFEKQSFLMNIIPFEDSAKGIKKDQYFLNVVLKNN